MTVASARPSRRAISLIERPSDRGNGVQAPQPCAVHAHDHPRASVATIPFAADGYPTCRMVTGRTTRRCLASRYIRAGARRLSANPEAAPPRDSRLSTSLSSKWEVTFRSIGTCATPRRAAVESRNRATVVVVIASPGRRRHRRCCHSSGPAREPLVCLRAGQSRLRTTTLG